jgi:DNA-binding CsgD family transcriptional regulator
MEETPMPTEKNNLGDSVFAAAERVHPSGSPAAASGASDPDNAVARFTRLLQSMKHAERALNEVARGITECLPFNRCSIFRYSNRFDQFEGVAGSGVDSGKIRQIRQPAEDIPLAKEILQSGVPHYFEDISQQNILPSWSIREYGITSLVIAPVYADGQPRGVVLLDRKGERFSIERKWLHASKIIAEQLGQSVMRTTFFYTETAVNVHLSRRETEVLQYSADGASTKEIAHLLNLSEHTVKDYVAAACLKLKARNRTEAVANALRRGLIQ